MQTAVETHCGNCGRPMRGERESCVYCGWSDNPAAAECRPVPRDLFRCGSTFWRFVLASILFAPLTYSVVNYGLTGPASERLPSVLFALAFGLPGPVVLLVQLLRRRRAVRTDHRGLVLPDSTEVEWHEVESVEHKPGLGGDVYSWEALSQVLPRGVGRHLSFILMPLLVLYYLVLPAAGLLSPWHPRVVVRLKTGREVVMPDLDRARAFVNHVRGAAE